jgi:hypothetical protein
MSLRRALILLVAACLLAGEVGAAPVEIAPFAGLTWGGSFHSSALQASVSLQASLSYGGTADFALSEHWRVELLYARQETELDAGGEPAFDVGVERYMAGIVEEKGEGRTHFFGAGLLGVTRFVPGLGGFGSESLFSVGVGLGVKRRLSERFALRGDLRGFYVVTQSGGGAFCGNVGSTCLFVFRSNGLWQGEVSGGVVIAF